MYKTGQRVPWLGSLAHDASRASCFVSGPPGTDSERRRRRRDVLFEHRCRTALPRVCPELGRGTPARSLPRWHPTGSVRGLQAAWAAAATRGDGNRSAVICAGPSPSVRDVGWVRCGTRRRSPSLVTDDSMSKPVVLIPGLWMTPLAMGNWSRPLPVPRRIPVLTPG